MGANGLGLPLGGLIDPCCCTCEPTEYVIWFCNVNRIPDDDFSIALNGHHIYDYGGNHFACTGFFLTTNGDIVPTDLPVPSADDPRDPQGDWACCQRTIARGSLDASFLNIPPDGTPPGNNEIRFTNTHVNCCGNVDILKIAGFYQDSEGKWKVCKVFVSQVFEVGPGGSPLISFSLKL